MKNLPAIAKQTDLVLDKTKKLLSLTQRLLHEKQLIYNSEISYRLNIGLGHNRSVSSLAITPDGNYIVSGSSKGAIKLWELKSGREIRTFNGHHEYMSG